MHRPVSAGLAPSGKQRGWQNQNRSSGVAWTFNLDELCADLAQRIHGLVEDNLLNPDAVMPASVIRAPGDASQQRERRAQQLDGRLSAAQAKHDDLLTATVGLRTAAGIFAAVMLFKEGSSARKRAIPLGPFLAAGAIVVLLFL